jgi:lysyl-tRNA synthetase class 2
LCRCFREEEVGHQHSREFTMLEWYRGHSDIDAIQKDTEELVAAVATAVRGRTEVVCGGRVIDVSPRWAVLTVAEAMRRFAKLEVRGDESAAVLKERLHQAGIDPGSATAWDDLFFTAFVDKVEPALADFDRPVILKDWPLPLAALARKKPGPLPVAERFEAYIAGIELANAFGELIDPVEQRKRFEGENALRKERGLPVYPIDEHLLDALKKMPESGGIALGVDRLVMLCLGRDSIAEIQTFADRDL